MRWRGMATLVWWRRAVGWGGAAAWTKTSGRGRLTSFSRSFLVGALTFLALAFAALAFGGMVLVALAVGDRC